MTNAAGFTITPLCVGWLLMDKGQFLFGRGFGEKIDIPVLVFYLDGNGHRVLVDTGCSDPAWSARHHYPSHRSPQEEPLSALATVGASAADIDTIILTHLHWDHCWNNDLFPNARFYVQREELRYAAAPLPVHHRGYETAAVGMTPRYASSRFEVIDGDKELLDGLTVFLMPGHTPGMQGVLVEGQERRYLIAGDNVSLGDNLGTDSAPQLVPGSNYVDLEAYYESLNLMTSLVDSEHIIPGHEKAVLEHGAYR